MKALTVPEVAREMDTIFPGWHLRVDPHSLVMPSTERCVLGQLGWFHDGIETLQEHGLYSEGRRTAPEATRYYKAGMFCSQHFRGAWIDEITARRASGAAPPPRQRHLRERLLVRT